MMRNAPNPTRRRGNANERALENARLSLRALQEASSSVEQVLLSLSSHRQGLTEADAAARLRQYGKNEVTHEKPPTWYVQLFKAFNNPFVWILVVLAAVSYLMDYAIAEPEDKDLTAVIILSVMVLVSGFLRFFQEYRSTQAAEKLKALVRTTATVIRRDHPVLRECAGRCP
jgi:Mg2+-importing ATPase